jgi:hypothetical protein
LTTQDAHRIAHTDIASAKTTESCRQIPADPVSCLVMGLVHVVCMYLYGDPQTPTSYHHPHKIDLHSVQWRQRSPHAQYTHTQTETEVGLEEQTRENHLDALSAHAMTGYRSCPLVCAFVVTSLLFKSREPAFHTVTPVFLTASRHMYLYSMAMCYCT